MTAITIPLSVQRHAAIPLETRGLLAELDSETGRLTVWGPTKVPHFNRGVLSKLLEFPEEKIHFIEPDVGGGFGIRGEFYPEDYRIWGIGIDAGHQMGFSTSWQPMKYVGSALVHTQTNAPIVTHLHFRL